MSATSLMPPRIDGLDGKSYPRRPLTRAARLKVILAAHDLHHDGRAMRAIAEQLHCSVGTVHAHLTKWRCENCVQVSTNVSPEHGTGGV